MVQGVREPNSEIMCQHGILFEMAGWQNGGDGIWVNVSQNYTKLKVKLLKAFAVILSKKCG